VNDPFRGTLRVLVFASPAGNLYLGHDGDPSDHELAMNVEVGGEWDDCDIYANDGPPDPPASGLWLMELDWRSLTDLEKAVGDSVDDTGDEITGRWVGEPRWTRVATPLDVATIVTEGLVAP
jgi:hypothetical protein